MLRSKRTHPYLYVKAPVKGLATQLDVSDRSPKPSRMRKLIPTILITLGSVLIANVAWPILSYQLFVAPQIRKVEFASPVNLAQLDQQYYPAEAPSMPNLAPQVLGADLDYTNARTWFPQADFDLNRGSVQEYTIHIPAVDVHDAQVIVGGEDLDEGLIHYPGTAIPGQLGSPVIFGHSVLRQFYNPSVNNPNRYVSIFSKIMTLKNGDEIIVDYDGITYTYEVKDKVEVEPEDIFILEQRYNNRELKLITCVPEGTYLRRGVVIAQLVDVE